MRQSKLVHKNKTSRKSTVLPHNTPEYGKVLSPYIITKIYNNCSLKDYKIMLTIATEKFQFSTHNIFHLNNLAFIKTYTIFLLGNRIIGSGE